MMINSNSPHPPYNPMIVASTFLFLRGYRDRVKVPYLVRKEKEEEKTGSGLGKK